MTRRQFSPTLTDFCLSLLGLVAIATAIVLRLYQYLLSQLWDPYSTKAFEKFLCGSVPASTKNVMRKPARCFSDFITLCSKLEA